MKFAEIIGQREQKNHLIRAVEKNKISHAYIISGEESSGKKMLAEAFAATLLCEKGGSDACGECISCRKAMSHNHPDIKYVTHEKPRTISVDDIREQLNGDVVIKPYESAHKVYIVEDAQLMKEPAQNALLKTLEEPPEYAIIMLLTTNADSFLQTIRSRCVTLETKPVPDDVIVDFLMKKHRIVDYEARAAAAFAQGNVGKAMELAASEDFTAKKDLAVNILSRITNANNERFIEMQTSLLDAKDDLDTFYELFTLWYRDVLLYKTTGQADRLIFNRNLFQIKQVAEEISYEKLDEIIARIEEAKTRRRQNVVPETEVPLILECMRLKQ